MNRLRLPPSPAVRGLLTAAAVLAALVGPVAVMARPAAVPAPPEDICTTPVATAAGRAGLRAVAVTPPDVVLQPASGRAASFLRHVPDTEAVLLNFVFTSCTTICPPMAQVFAAAQERLGPQASGVRFVSVSIDPEHDTPKRLQAYAARFGAGPQWTFLTGSATSVQRVQKAFHVWQPDKMGHAPVTFWKPAGGSAWWRLDGLASPDQLVRLVADAAAR